MMFYVLIACLLLLHETAAEEYMEGLVRFFPLDGNYKDFAGSGWYDLHKRYNRGFIYDDDDSYYIARDKFNFFLAQDDLDDRFVQDGAIGFEESTPYPNGHQSRKVLKLGFGADFLQGSAEGLPEGNAPRTIMGWLKKTKDTFISAPFFYGSTTECNRAYYVLLPNSNKDQVHLNQLCQVYDEGVNSAAETISDNKWYHVAFTYNGEMNSAYLDGKLVESGTPIVPPNTDTTPDVAFTAIGPYGKFEGYLADFAIFNRALSAEEVKAIYDSPNGIEVTPSPGCNDKKGKWKIGSTGKKMNWCKWAKRKNTPKRCGRKDLNKVCPVTCSFDKKGKWKIGGTGKKMNWCKWATKKKPKRCGWKDIYKSCPVTCSLC